MDHTNYAGQPLADQIRQAAATKMVAAQSAIVRGIAHAKTFAEQRPRATLALTVLTCAAVVGVRLALRARGRQDFKFIFEEMQPEVEDEIWRTIYRVRGGRKVPEGQEDFEYTVEELPTGLEQEIWRKVDERRRKMRAIENPPA